VVRRWLAETPKTFRMLVMRLKKILERMPVPYPSESEGINDEGL